MTEAIFAALELRFNASPALVTTGRKLLQGFDEERDVNVVRPYTEVNIDKTSANLSTWDSDIDEWDLRFRYHAKDLRTRAAETWLGAMRAAFKDSNVSNYAFHCCGVREAALSAPRNKDSAYDAAIRFLMTVQWRVNSPVTRYA
jgi:hypothetical protein